MVTLCRSFWEEAAVTRARKIIALQISPKVESLYGLGRQATKL